MGATYFYEFSATVLERINPLPAPTHAQEGAGPCGSATR